jgi:Na+/melibiose symporter-like transporter|tara:strand:- start:382 stop:579 length:198 start_codon:yes stop_codon:yes gene_type:complete
MIYLILVLTITNTVLIFYFYKKQNKVNQQIIEALKAETEEIEAISDENKKHIDDMLKMREMYESD